MRMFCIHIIFTYAMVWFLPLQPKWLTWCAGFFGSYVVLLLIALITKKFRYPIRLYRAVVLFIYFHFELFKSCLKVLWDILTPRHKSKPGFIALPLEAKTDLEIFFTANLISLTPGTLSMDISPDHKTLYIHAMFIDDLDKTMAALKHFETKILRVFR